ncbi:MAG: type II toxin-antitoxin system VapC family toxin [Euryarchaeota archaeon]|nr:type II toxin-antitoxin system VapC family toxin [Euryarchaeota archaeon]
MPGDPASVVVDSSALIDSVDSEKPGLDEAFALIAAEHELLAPVLLASECGNVVHRKRAARFGRDAMERAGALELLLGQVTLVLLDAEDRRRAGSLVEEAGVTYYDAEFLALADARGAALLSQDSRLRDAARKILGPERVLDVRGRV